VLVLGAEGQVGQIATRAARLLGASQVVGAVREPESLEVVLAAGADGAVSTADLDTLGERLRAVLPDGVDLILDMVWGPVISRTIDVARPRARVVQVGNAGGAWATVAAPMFRNKLVSILPHSNFFFTAAERAAAYEELAGHAASGALRLAVERVPLADVPVAWRRLKTAAASRKLIVVP
jgi:NADPH2:quinone reductase